MGEVGQGVRCRVPERRRRRSWVVEGFVGPPRTLSFALRLLGASGGFRADVNFRSLAERDGKPVYWANGRRRPPEQRLWQGSEAGSIGAPLYGVQSGRGQLERWQTWWAMEPSVRSTGGRGKEGGEFRFGAVGFPGRGGVQMERATGQ